MSKGYTIQYFLNTFAGVSNTALNRQGVYDVVSPRYGAESIKAFTLDEYLSGRTLNVYRGVGGFSNLGKTPRTRLINALKLRKKLGYFPA